MIISEIFIEASDEIVPSRCRFWPCPFDVLMNRQECKEMLGKPGMKNLFEAATLEELQERLACLKPDSERQWGKMDPAQMLAHCSEWMEIGEGVKNPPRSLIGRVFGRFAKSRVLNEGPIARNMPTDSSLIVNDEREFALERQPLKRRMERFTTAGPEGCTGIRIASSAR